MSITLFFEDPSHYQQVQNYLTNNKIDFPSYEYTGSSLTVRTDNAMALTQLVKEYTWVVVGARY